MAKVILTENDLIDLIKSIITESNSNDINIINPSAEYVLTNDEMYKLTQDLYNVYDFFKKINGLSPNNAEYVDRFNRVKRSIKMLNKKLNN